MLKSKFASCGLATLMCLAAIGAKAENDAEAPAAETPAETPRRTKPKKLDFTQWADATAEATRCERPILALVDFPDEPRCGKIKSLVLNRPEFKAFIAGNLIYYRATVPGVPMKKGKKNNQQPAAPKVDVAAIRKSESAIITALMGGMKMEASSFPRLVLANAQGQIVEAIGIPDPNEKPFAAVMAEVKAAMEKGNFLYTPIRSAEKYIATEEKKFNESKKRAR